MAGLADGEVSGQVAVKRAQVIGMGIIPKGQWERASLKERMILVDEVLAWMYGSGSATSTTGYANLPG